MYLMLFLFSFFLFSCSLFRKFQCITMTRKENYYLGTFSYNESFPFVCKRLLLNTPYTPYIIVSLYWNSQVSVPAWNNSTDGHLRPFKFATRPWKCWCDVNPLKKLPWKSLFSCLKWINNEHFFINIYKYFLRYKLFKKMFMR
jgi:hypothetical protein